MEKKIQIVPSGISLVDKSWGGFYRGGTYFLIGQHKSGKTLLGIQYVKECVKQKEVCLFFTTMRPKDLMFHAASIDFDLQHYMDQNLIIVIRVTPPPAGQANKDEKLAEYFVDIAALVKQYYPNRIIFDELTPFIEFQNLNLLQNAFLQAVEIIEESNITSLFILGEPATMQSKSLVDILTAESTGIIYLDKEEDELKIKGGRITIVPNVGHIEGRFSADYFLMPYKGITSEKIDEKVEKSQSSSDSGYKKLSELELPAVAYPSFNFYSFDELVLYINNQIALYKSTKQKFSVVSLSLKLKRTTC
jgi:KaiC/GvpD/RAD55 family RecA-like ATPase